MASERNYWIMKCEPAAYSIRDLANDRRCYWEGVRNYQARNYMREMKVNDEVFFYHSNAKPSGIAGRARVCKDAYPDHTALDENSRYYDSKSTAEANRWSMVDIEFIEEFPRIISLKEMKQQNELDGMPVLQKGSRLSILPVADNHFLFILKWKETLK